MISRSLVMARESGEPSLSDARIASFPRAG